MCVEGEVVNVGVENMKMFGRLTSFAIIECTGDFTIFAYNQFYSHCQLILDYGGFSQYYLARHIAYRKDSPFWVDDSLFVSLQNQQLPELVQFPNPVHLLRY